MGLGSEQTFIYYQAVVVKVPKNGETYYAIVCNTNLKKRKRKNMKIILGRL